jgi:hypothetical protein
MSTTAAEMSWEDIKALVAELAIQSKETDRKFQETDRLLKERSEETERKFRETDRKFQETRELIDRLAKENSRELKKLGEQIGGLGDKFGYFAEGMALPSMERLLEKRFHMTNVSARHRVRDGGREQEYDVLAWANGKVNQAIVVEVKSRVKKEAIEQLILQIERLPKLVPELSGKTRLGILAGVDWDRGVMEEAQAQGLYTAWIHDEVFDLTTPKTFQPRLW